MIKSLDVHPIYDTLLHIDLIEIDVKKRIKVSVPLEFIGVSKGVKLSGGLMNINLRVLKVECLATDIPPFIEVHVDDLDIGDMLRVKELKIDAAVTILSDLESMIVSVTEPKAEVEPEVVEAVEGEEVAEGEEAEKPKEGAADSKEPAEPESK